MNKKLLPIISLFLILPIVSHAQITDFINKSSQPKFFLYENQFPLSDLEHNIKKDLAQGKNEFNNDTNNKPCFEKKKINTNISGIIVGEINRKNDNIYLVQSKNNELNYLKKEKNNNSYKMGQEVNEIINTSFCKKEN